jgi:large subunit ribosomal protein L11
MIKKAAGVEKGSATPHTEKVGKVTRAQLKEIAEVKYNDMNANDMDAAIKQLEGTARNMGITVEK